MDSTINITRNASGHPKPGGVAIWMLKAAELLAAGEQLMRSAEEQAQRPNSTSFRPPLVAPATMLLGMACELLLKGLYFENHGETAEQMQIVARKYSHKLPELATEVGLSLNDSNRQLLSGIGEAIVNVGRYPTDLKGEVSGYSINMRVVEEVKDFFCIVLAKLPEGYDEFISFTFPTLVVKRS